MPTFEVGPPTMGEDWPTWRRGEGHAIREDAWPEDLARPRCVTCRLGHMFVTLRLVFPGPLFPSYLSGGGHEDISADVFGTAELAPSGDSSLK